MLEISVNIDFSQWPWWQVTILLCLIIMIFKGKYKEVLNMLKSLIPGTKDNTEK